MASSAFLNMTLLAICEPHMLREGSTADVRANTAPQLYCCPASAIVEAGWW